MKTSIKTLSICLLIVSLLTACTNKKDINTSSSNAGNTLEEPTESVERVPEWTPRFTFEEILLSKAKYFVVNGDVFQVKSPNENYYGEITVGQRSYIDGASGDLEGTYALFVTDAYNANVLLDISYKKEGYTYKNQFTGTKKGDAVEYPFDTNDLFNSLMVANSYNTMYLSINNLSYLYADWRSSKSVLSERAFNMLAVAISKNEAIRYVEDGTLPKALEGLTVTGLDKIFINPEDNPEDKSEAPKGMATIIEIVAPKYGDVDIFSDGMAAVSTQYGAGGRWGYIDEDGNELIPPQFLRAEPFSDGLALVQSESGGWGYIDKSGKDVIPFGTYTGGRTFSGGFATVYKDDNQAVISTTGEVIVPEGKYKYIEPFREGLAVVKLGANLGVIDTSGNEVIAPTLAYSRIGQFKDGIATVKTDKDKWGFIDKTGNEIIPPQYNNALEFSEGLAAVNRGANGNGIGGNWGFVDVSGNEVIPISYSGRAYNGESFSGGTVSVVASITPGGDGKKKIIDVDGNLVTSLEQYSLVGPFIEGLATCGEGVIDKEGNLLAVHVEGEYRIERTKRHTTNIIPTLYEHKYGFIKIVK